MNKNIFKIIKSLVDSELSTEPLEITCPNCKETYRLSEMGKEAFEIERQVIEQNGECIRCDHIRGDLLEMERLGLI